MAFLTQNMNQFRQAPILGLVDEIPTPDVVSAQILSTSVAVLQAGSLVKLVTGTSGSILVDGVTGPTDGPVFGVIPYNARKNIYAANDIVEVVTGGGYVYMRSSAAIVRGTRVAGTAATTTTDPLVTTDTTAAHYICGVAIDEATAANQLIRVKVQPALNP